MMDSPKLSKELSELKTLIEVAKLDINYIKGSVDKTEKHLRELNGSVARNRNDINSLLIQQSNMTGEVGVLSRDYHANREIEIRNIKKENKKWRLHAMWAGIIILWTILQSIGLVNFNLPI